MDENTNGFMSRVGGWLRRSRTGSSEADNQSVADNQIITTSTRTLFGNGAKRDQAIANLQNGFSALAELMTSIKDNLNDQGKRQDELLKYLSHLPAAIEGIPETNRLNAETLKAISSRLEQTNSQQNLIGEILNKLAENDTHQKKSIDDVRSGVENFGTQNKQIAENLSTVGSAMQTVSKTSQASASVLEQVRDNIDRRDGQLERILHRQAARFTSMLIVAIFIAIAALAAVLVMGWWVINHPSNGPQPTSPAAVHGTL